MIGAAEKKLYDAASNGDVTAFQEVVEEDAYLLEEATFACSRNLLHIATMRGQAGIVEEVLNMNPQLARSLDSQNSSPLHIAAAKGNVEITQKLLSVAPQMCWSLDCQNMNPIHIAAINGHVKVLKELLRSDYLPAMERVHRGQTVLHLCVKHRQLRALKVLVEKLGDFVCATDDDGETILHWAVRGKQLEPPWRSRPPSAPPPGGVWQDDSSTHKAGEAVMASTHPKIYKHFVRANTTAFVSSLIIIFLITTRLPSRNEYVMALAIFTMWASLTSISVSYGASLKMITPNTETKSLSNVIGIAVAVPLTYMGVINVWSRIRPRYLRWKTEKKPHKKSVSAGGTEGLEVRVPIGAEESNLDLDFDSGNYDRNIGKEANQEETVKGSGMDKADGSEIILMG